MRRAALLLAMLALTSCGQGEDAAFQGYVEGEFVQVAPEVGGRILELAVDRGSEVQPGDLLFRLDDQEPKAAANQAGAELARAEAELRNRLEGQRPPEIAVIEAQIAEARASLQNAQKDFDRQRQLFERGVTAESRLDQAREAVSVAGARVATVERQKDVAEMPARTPEIDAARRAAEAAGAALAQAETKLGKHVVRARSAGRIEDVYYEEGEVAAVGAPVLSLLPEGRRKVIFFVAEPARPALTVGSELAISCDGCPAGLGAPVSFLATEAEYTPPVIFSRGNREKLVFRAEAPLAGEAARLPLGQPVDVRLGASP